MTDICTGRAQVFVTVPCMKGSDTWNQPSSARKGQVVISKKIRVMFHIKQGTRVHFEARNGEIVLTPLTPSYFERMAGCLGTGGKATKALFEDRKRTRKL